MLHPIETAIPMSSSNTRETRPLVWHTILIFPLLAVHNFCMIHLFGHENTQVLLSDLNIYENWKYTGANAAKMLAKLILETTLIHLRYLQFIRLSG